MNTFVKYATASVLATALSACATTGVDTAPKSLNTAASIGGKMAEAAPIAAAKNDVADMAPETQMETAPVETKAEMKEDSVMVGGAAMLSSKTIVENASQAENLTTLVSAVKKAGLVETLSGDGPFTVFAPTNAAFSYLPEGVVADLMKDENKAQLVKVLTGHVVPGELNSDFLMAVVAGGRTYDVTTVSGDTLTFYKMGDGVRVADENGTLGKIETADVKQSNGVVHVISTVLVPK